MLNIIKRFFKKKDTANDKKHNCISFYVDENCVSHINIELKLQSSQHIKEFGKLLYLINSGNLEQNILNTMVTLSQKKPKLTDLVQQCMVHWASLVKSNIEKSISDNESKPYIKPTEVFHVTSQ